MKKLFKATAAALGAAFLMFSSISITAWAEEVKEGFFKGEDDGTSVTITGLDDDTPWDNEEQLTIPQTMNGHPVTAIGEKAFDSNTDIKAMVLPNGITTIGAAAFNNAFGITSITIPATVTSIDATAFTNCDGLKTVNFGGDEAAWTQLMADTEAASKGKTDVTKYTLVENTSLTINYNAEIPDAAPTDDDTSSAEEATEETDSGDADSGEEGTSETDANTEEETGANTETDSTTTGETDSASIGETGNNKGETTGNDEEGSDEDEDDGDSVNVAYVAFAVLVGIAVLDIIYFSIKKPAPEPTEEKKQ